MEAVAAPNRDVRVRAASPPGGRGEKSQPERYAPGGEGGDSRRRPSPGSPPDAASRGRGALLGEVRAGSWRVVTLWERARPAGGRSGAWAPTRGCSAGRLAAREA